MAEHPDPDRPQLRSFRIARPLVAGSSQLEITSVVALTLLAIAIWLLVLPVELLHFAAS